MNNSKIHHKIWWDEKDKIVRSEFYGDADEKVAKEQIESMSKFYKTLKGDILVLIDLTQAGSTTSKARTIYADALKKMSVKKHAFIVKNIVLKVTVDFIMKASGAKNVKFFNDNEEALQWLKI
jgi:hypothetical protein